MKHNLAHGLRIGNNSDNRHKKVILRKRYRSQTDYLKFHNHKTVAFLMSIALIVGFIGFKSRLVEKAEARMTVYAKESNQATAKLLEVRSENDALRAKLNFSAKIVTSDTTKQVSIYYIHKYFPQSAWKDVEATMRCESNLNNLSTNWHNTNGSIDRGLYMINSVHAGQFKTVTGMDYSVGAYDWDASSKFARWLYDHSGLQPWVCYQIVKGSK